MIPELWGFAIFLQDSSMISECALIALICPKTPAHENQSVCYWIKIMAEHSLLNTSLFQLHFPEVMCLLPYVFYWTPTLAQN